MPGKPLTKEEEAILLAHYPTTDTAAMMALMPGRSVKQIYNHANKLGVKKDTEWLRAKNKALVLKIGISTRFKKGNEPYSQGKTGVRVSPKSEFKKGSLPGNTLYDGAIVIRKDTPKKSYKYIRVALGKWELLQRKVWIEHFGEIPQKHIVTFKDGDTLNCDISNLELISMAENLRRNSVGTGWKRSYAHKEKLELGIDPTGVYTLSDSYVAGIISKENKEQVLANKPLIELKRKQLLLNRAIKNQKQ